MIVLRVFLCFFLLGAGSGQAADIFEEFDLSAKSEVRSGRLAGNYQSTCSLYLLNKTGQKQGYYIALNEFRAKGDVEADSPVAIEGDLVGSLQSDGGKAVIKIHYPEVSATSGKSKVRQELQCGARITVKNFDPRQGNIVGKVVLSHLDRSGKHKSKTHNFILKPEKR